MTKEPPRIIAHPAFLEDLRRLLPPEQHESVRALLERGDATLGELVALLPDIELVPIEDEDESA